MEKPFGKEVRTVFDFTVGENKNQPIARTAEKTEPGAAAPAQCSPLTRFRVGGEKVGNRPLGGCVGDSRPGNSSAVM